MHLKRGWLKGVLEAARKEVKKWPAWMRGTRSRAYSIAGWKRDKEGFYRNGESMIFQRGRAWIRQDLAAGAGNVPVDESYPTLRAAIKQEKPPAPPLLREI